MAIIYSYPDKSSPSGSDVLVITDSQQTAPNKNRTKSLTLENLASYVTTSQSGITGSGTLNTIAMFTPDSQKIGDSIMTFTTGPDAITVGGRLIVTDDFVAQGRAEFSGPYLRANCPLEVKGVLQDNSSFTGTAGQVLTSTGTGVAWANNASSDTTYDLTGQVSNITDFAIALTGSDGTLDKVSLIAGSNITLTDNGSNGVTIASKYTSYVVKIQQAGTADPVLTEFENSTPFTFTATRTGVGQFDIIPSSSFVDPDKVYVQYGGSNILPPSVILVKSVNTTEVRAINYSLPTNTNVDDFGPAYLELRIYP